MVEQTNEIIPADLRADGPLASEPGPTAPAPAVPPPDYATEAGETLARATQGVADIVGRLSQAARAEAAVGPAETVGGRTVVPLASVRVTAGWGLGFGGGGGTDPRQNQGGGSGGGAGGGGLGSSRVIALAEISESGVNVRPIPDVTALALGAMALIGLRMISRRGGVAGDRVARGRLLRLLRRR